MLPLKSLKYWAETFLAPRSLQQRKYEAFKILLECDSQALDLVADLEELFYGRNLSDRMQANCLQAQISQAVYGMVEELQEMHPHKFKDLMEEFQRINLKVRNAVAMPAPNPGPPYSVPLAAAGECPELAGEREPTWDVCTGWDT